MGKKAARQVDPAANELKVQRAKNVVAHLHEVWTKGEDVAWEKGQDYNSIVDEALAKALGFRYTRELMAHEFCADYSQATLSAYGRVAKAFTQEQARKYKVTNLGKLLEYQSVAHAGPTTGDPGQFPIRVPGKNGTTSDMPFSACSTRDISAAIASFKGPREGLPPEALDLKGKVAAALTA
ncbi:MAG: hypothetical protein HY901_24510, partial [Deltaproteobacteria bacterium]|nr:hypothetical protein [Deltaproteobacteria bacterium]